MIYDKETALERAGEALARILLEDEIISGEVESVAAALLEAQADTLLAADEVTGTLDDAELAARLRAMAKKLREE